MARILVLLAALAATAAAVPPVHPGFDLLLLVRNFPPTFCQMERCTRQPISYFTLHGLWPEHANGSWPEYCPGASQPLPGSTDPMACEWPSLSGPDHAFHQHEWDKHGTCAAPLLGHHPAYYFNTTLRLHSEYDINAALAAAHILPERQGRATPTVAVVGALADAFGAEPLLSCHGDAVLEVWVCLNLGLRAVECPPRVGPRRSCGANVILPEGVDVRAFRGEFPVSCCRLYHPA
jgi:ribonuclease T2